MGCDFTEDAESHPFLDKGLLPQSTHVRGIKRRLSQRIMLWTWGCATALLVFTTVSLALQLQRLPNNGSSCASQHAGLSSELEAARLAIGYHDIIFTSGIEEDENENMFLNLPTSQPRYVGAPSPEVDAAWADLTKATEIWVNGDEASSVANRTIHSEHGWLVSLDVYHSLHCVNLARQGLDWDYYYGDQPGQKPVTAITKDHIYHCLEHLRQVVMCHGDLTPMRFQYTKHSAMPIWEAPHTCRNWDKIREWAEARRRKLKVPLSNSHHS